MDVRTFLTEFGRIANTPNGVQRLREMVFQLAIKGELCKQNDLSENARLYFQKLHSEKQKLISLGIAKRPKQHVKKIVPFEIPKDWIWTMLEALCIDIHYGYTAKAIDRKDGVRLLRITDIQNDKVNWFTVPSCDLDAKKLKSNKLKDGDLLIARTGGTIGKSYLVENLTIQAVFASYLIRLIPLPGINSQYLKLFTLSTLYWDQLYDASTGTGQPNVNATSLKSLQIPIPSLKEQKRIVAKVDELVALCNRLEAQQQKRSELAKLTRTAVLDALANAQSPNELKVAWKRVQKNMGLLFERPEDVGELRNVISQLAVEGYLTNTKEEISRWKISKLKDCAKDLFTGPFGTALHKKDYIDNGTPVINPSNIHTGKILPNRSVTVDKKTLKRLSKYQVIENDIIVGRRGEMGRCAVVKPNQSGWLCGTGSMLIRPNRLVFPDFLAAVIRSPRGKLQLSDNSVGITMSNLNQKALTNLSFLLPPYEVQEDIIKRYGEFTTVCDILESQLTKARSIAEKLAQSAVAAITGTQIEDKEKMKAPKTELVTKLRLRKSPSTKEQAPLCTILGKHNSELSAKALWNYSGLAIDDFYCQLKTEMTNGWIDEPQKAEMKIVEEKEPVK